MEKTKKAVIYARYSSGNQREESIDSQLRICQKFADDHGYKVIQEYTDSALSGRTDQRPAFQRMISDSAKKRFDTVLVYAHDRFSRNTYDMATYKARLKKSGVRIISATVPLDDSPESGLMESILEGFAQYYSENLSRSIKRGLEENMLNCKCNGGQTPLGYKIVNGKYEIDPISAKAVELIFTEYASGTSKKKIIDELNNKGFKTAKGKLFAMNSLNRILSNKLYTGVYKYDHHETAGAVPAIIDQKLFEKVQEQAQRNKRSKKSVDEENDYLLSGKLFCGICGAPMIGESGKSKTGNIYRYYTCANRKRPKNGERCEKHTERKEELESAVLDYINQNILTDETIERIASEAMDAYAKETSNKTLLASYEQEHKEVSKKIDNILEAIESGIYTPKTKQRLEELEERLEELETKIIKEKLKAPEFTKDHFIFWLEQFRSGAIDDVEHKRKVINCLVNSIHVYNEKNDGDSRQIAIIINITSRPTKTIKGSDLNTLVEQCERYPNYLLGNRTAMFNFVRSF